MYIDKRQLKHFFFIFSILLFVLVLPSLLPLQSAGEKQTVVEQNGVRSQLATVSSVFNNNLVVALVSLIPVSGWIWIGYVLWSTGMVVASYNNVVVAVFLNPFVYVELGVYSFVVLKSIRLLQLFRRRKTVFTDLDGQVVTRKTTGVYYEMGKTFAVVLIVCSVVLLASAFAEIYMIRGSI